MISIKTMKRLSLTTKFLPPPPPDAILTHKHCMAGHSHEQSTIGIDSQFGVNLESKLLIVTLSLRRFQSIGRRTLIQMLISSKTPSQREERTQTEKNKMFLSETTLPSACVYLNQYQKSCWSKNRSSIPGSRDILNDVITPSPFL